MTTRIYHIPGSLRSKPNIDQVLNYGRYYPEVEDEYIDLLQKEENFAARFKDQYDQFNREYRIEAPRNPAVKTTHLYKALHERRESSVHEKAVYEYWKLFRLKEEYEKLDEIVKNRKSGGNFSYTMPSTTGQHVQRLNHLGATTIHIPGKQNSADSVLDNTGRKDKDETIKKLHQLLNEQGEEIKSLRRNEKENLATIEDLRNRLSGFASRQLTEGNPNFTDLSDKNRPTKIAEKFHSMYDEEWTNALEKLSEKKYGKINEEEAIFLLMNIIKEVYKLCCQIIEEQTQSIVVAIMRPCAASTTISERDKEIKDARSGMEKQIMNIRRTYCMAPIQDIIKKFKDKSKDFKTYQSFPEIHKYTDKLVEYLWLMRTSDPPMALQWPEQGDELDLNLYNHYTKKGNRVSVVVWPAVLLHDDGPIIHKGFVKPM